MKQRSTFRTNQTLDDFQELDGQPFTIVGSVDPESYDADEIGPMFRIAVNGREVEAFQDEVYDLEPGESFISAG